MTKVLVVDDDPHIREVVSFALAREGFTAVEAEDGKRALSAFEQHGADLVVLDITLPEMDGTEVCRTLRQSSTVPIVFLTSRDDEIDRIVGLEIGGDDYVAKPFSPRELVARIRAILRRTELSEPRDRDDSPPRALSHGRAEVEPESYKAFWSQREVVLTATEFGILRTLMERPGKVYSRDELMQRAYPGTRVVSSRTIDSHVRRLRSKFRAVGGDPVETVHGLGYKLGPC